MADEDSKSGDPASSAGAGIPEVEVEIVQEGEPAAQEGAFAGRDPSANAEAAGVHSEPAPKRMPFTPGVILFLGFAGLALAVFVLWRLGGPDGPPVAKAPQAIDEAAPPADALEEKEIEAPIVDNETDPAPAPDFAAAPAGDAPDASAGPAAEATASVIPDKIENNAPPELKSAAREIDPVTDIAPGGDVYLPPLGSEKAAPVENQTLQQAAKDAFRASDPAREPASPGNNDQPAPPPNDETLTFDVDGGEVRPTANQPSLAIGGSDESTKVLNQMSVLKESFEAEKAQLMQALENERQRNASQRDEIETLRRDFQTALSARDEEANVEILGLQERLDKIRNDEITPVARRIAGAVVLNSLERAFDRGEPFATELDQLEQAAPGALAINTLRQYAATGVVSLPILKGRFGEAARNALAAAGKENAKGFWGALKAQVQSIISIRPAKPQAGSSARAVVSRAEYAVENDDLAGALAELKLLSPAARDAMAPWITDAQARNEAAAAIEDLNNLVLGAL